jgi:hypothetical protein
MDPRLLTQPTVSRWQAYSLRLLMLGQGCPLPASADPVPLARTGTDLSRFDPDHMVCRRTKPDLQFVQESRARCRQTYMCQFHMSGGTQTKRGIGPRCGV